MRWVLWQLHVLVSFIPITASPINHYHSDQLDTNSAWALENPSMETLNKEALIDCLENRYEKALNIFNHVTNNSWEKDEIWTTWIENGVPDKVLEVK